MNKKVINSGIWFTVSNFIVRSIGFITTPIFTRILSNEEFGEYNNFVTWVSILLVISSLNLEASLIRARFDFEKDLKNYVFSMIALSSISTIIWYAIVNLFSQNFVDFFSIDSKYINCMFIYLLFYPAINLFQTMERFQYKYKGTVAISLLIAVSSSLLSVIFVYVMPDRLTGRIIGYCLPVALIGVAILIYFGFNRCHIRLNYWKYAVPFTLPFIPHLLAMNLLSGMDRIMIKKSCGAGELALYSLAYTCGTIITILVTSINSAFSPWLGERLAKKEYQQVKKISLHYVATFCYCAGGAVLVIPEILLLLGGRDYLAAEYVMPPVAASTILQFIYCMYVNVEQFEKKTKMMALASVLSAAINYILNWFFIPQFGYVAAAYTTYASYLVLMLLHMLIVKRIGMSKVYKNAQILILACACSMTIFLTSLIMEAYFIRYVIVVIYAIIGAAFLYKYKEIIIKYLNRK